jgi:hypothetical protein
MPASRPLFENAGRRSCDLLLEFGDSARETRLLEQSPHLRLQTGHFLFSQFLDGLRSHVCSGEAAHEEWRKLRVHGHRTTLSRGRALGAYLLFK